MRIHKVTPAGEPNVFLECKPLFLPKRVAIGNDGSMVAANLGNADLLTFSPGSKLMMTEQAAQAGSDNLVIMRDGTKICEQRPIGRRFAHPSWQAGGVDRDRNSKRGVDVL